MTLVDGNWSNHLFLTPFTFIFLDPAGNVLGLLPVGKSEQQKQQDKYDREELRRREVQSICRYFADLQYAEGNEHRTKRAICVIGFRENFEFWISTCGVDVI